MKPGLQALGLGEKLVGGAFRRSSPGFESSQLVQGLSHHSLEAAELRREVVHGFRQCRFELGRFPRRQFAAAQQIRVPQLP